VEDRTYASQRTQALAVEAALAPKNKTRVRIFFAQQRRNVMVAGRNSAATATSPRKGSESPPREYDFGCAYQIAIASDDDRTSEQWARALWEGAPGPLRWFMVIGWRLGLGLRLGPRSSPGHILGWRIVDTKAEETVCRASSRFLEATNTFVKADTKMVWSTLISYERPAARVVWLPVSPLHRLLVRVSLRRVAGGYRDG